jgi:hypothetical protein
MPDLATRNLSLADLLIILAERGTTVRIMHRPDHPQTAAFLRKLPPMIERRWSEPLHEKGLIGSHCYLRGSMNFTYSGVNLNDESIELTTEPEQVALALLEADHRWEGLAL